MLWQISWLLLAAPAEGSLFLIDQHHDLANAFEAYHNIETYRPVQEFVPSLGALDAVDLWTLDLGYPSTNGAGATLQALILTGEGHNVVVAESEPVALPDSWDGPARFALKGRIDLDPGHTYAITLKVLEGDSWGIRSYGQLFPSYPQGHYLIGGGAVESLDIWFRTIVYFEPPTLTIDSLGTLRWQGIPFLPYTVWSSRDLSHWSIVGTAQSSSYSITFSNSPLDSLHQFYRVSYP